MSDQEAIPRLSRLTAILTLLQSKQLVTAGEIARRFGISARTAYRDIKALEASGVPIYTEEGKGYRLVDGYNLPPILFTDEEANALITAEKYIVKNKDQSLSEHYQSAITKIKASLRQPQRDTANLLSERVVFVANIEKEKTSAWLAPIQRAITHPELLEINYQAANADQASKREIEPQALYHINENWILIAWCRLRYDYREFRLDRIQALRSTGEAIPKRDFNFIQYYKAYKMEPDSN